MIKFFRHIRQSLIQENKTSPNDSVGRVGKYFKYAIGEIILVVIGILIALQINNWNENRKSNIHGQNLMKELLKEFQLHIEGFDYGLDRQIEGIEKQQRIFKIENLEDMDADSLFDIFGFANIDVNITSYTYEKIKNQGIGSLSKNDSLNEAINHHLMLMIDLYNRRVDYYLERDKARVKYLKESNLQFNNDIVKGFPRINEDIIKADRLNFIYKPRTKAIITESYYDKESAIEFLIISKKRLIALSEAIHKELSLTETNLAPLPNYDKYLDYKISE